VSQILVKKQNAYLNSYEKYYISSDLLCAEGICLLQLNRIVQAERKFLLASYMTPNRFTPKYHLLKLYLQTKNLEKVREVAKNILNSRVKIPSPQVSIILLETHNILDSLKDK
jgi:hypothetical protein